MIKGIRIEYVSYLFFPKHNNVASAYEALIVLARGGKKKDTHTMKLWFAINVRCCEYNYSNRCAGDEEYQHQWYLANSPVPNCNGRVKRKFKLDGNDRTISTTSVNTMIMHYRLSVLRLNILANACPTVVALLKVKLCQKVERKKRIRKIRKVINTRNIFYMFLYIVEDCDF